MSPPYRAGHLGEDHALKRSSSAEDIEPLIHDDRYKEEHTLKSLQPTRALSFSKQKPNVKIWLIHVSIFILYTLAFLVITKSATRAVLAGKGPALVYCS